MHHNRSLLLDIEVLLGITNKTSICSTKLLDVVLNFYFIYLSIFLNFRISIKFLDFYQIAELLPNFYQMSEF